MAVAGSLTYDTKIDKNGFEKGLNSLKTSTNSAFSQIRNIVAGLGIDKLISTTMNTITSSIDSAISRVDTIHSYERTMKNLGYTSNEVSDSMNKLKKGIEGLPTTLPAVVSMQQQYSALRGSIGEATELTIALNDATLAGGQGQEIANSAMEQWYQIIANGKPDLQSWKIISSAMPAQLNQIAEACMGSGKKSQDLFNAWKDGKVTTDEVISALIRLDSEGTGSLASFSQQAQDSSGGINTSMTNIKTAITNALAEIIENIGQENITNFLNSIKQLIKDITPSVVKFVNIVIENMPKVISFIKDVIPYAEAVGVAFLSWKIGSTIQSAVQGFQEAQVALSLFSMQANGASIAQGLFNGSLTLGQTLVGLFTGKVTLAELATAGWAKAQKVLNAVMHANPIALIVAAIAALVAGFIYLWNTSEGFRNFWKGLWNGIKSIFEAVCNGIITFFTETIPNAWNNFITSLQNFVNSIWETLVNVWNNIVSFFTETIPQWIQNVINWFANLPYMIGYHIGQIWGNLIKFGLNVWNWITVDLPQIIQSIIDWFAQLPRKDMGMATKHYS